MTKGHLYVFHALNISFGTAYFSETGSKPKENELFAISVNVVLIGSVFFRKSAYVIYTISLVYCAYNERISFWFISAKLVRSNLGKLGNKMTFW